MFAPKHCAVEAGDLDEHPVQRKPCGDRSKGNPVQQAQAGHPAAQTASASVHSITLCPP
jgi:hypothetical protein